MNAKVMARRSLALAASTTFILGMFPLTAAQADSTVYISPEDTPGNYQQWIRSDDPAFINDLIGCGADSGSDNWVASGGGVPVGSRGSAIITIPVEIPDGATIDSVDIQVCQARASGGLDGATFQTFARVDAADIDSGVDIVAATPSTNRTVTIQNIPVGVVKSGATTLEVGVLRTNDISAALVYSMAARINYSPVVVPPLPGSAQAVPVFGPFGLLFTVLGVGLLGAWRARRKG